MLKRADAIRSLTSLLLLGYIFYKFVDWKNFFNILNNMDIRYYILGYSFFFLGILFSVARWKHILSANGQEISYLLLLKLSFIGSFYNLFLPGTISGDLVKAYKTSKSEGDSMKLFTSVIMDRMVGLLSLIIVMLFGILFLNKYLNKDVIESLLACTGASLAFFIALVNRRLRAKILITCECIPIGRINLSKNLARFLEPFSTLVDKDLLSKSMVFSMLFNICSCAPIYFIAKSIGVNIPILFILGISPIITLVTIFPISYSGLGLREGLYIYFYGSIGISPEVSVTLSLIGFTMRIITGIVGGILELT